MCLLVSAPKGSQIPFELLEDATRRNSDGWGVMWHDGNRIQVHKDPNPSPEAIYDLTKANPHQTLVHLRMTTHGDNSHDNTHPFEVIPERLYMMHNGVIDVDAPRHLLRSDTRVVVEDYLRPMITKPGHLNNPGLQKFIQNLIGTSSNRLAFLDDAGKVTYFNKHLGMEWRGIWCSNTYAWSLHDEGTKKSTHAYATKKVAYQSYSDWRDDDYGYDYGKDSWFSHSSKAMQPAKPDKFALIDDEDDGFTSFNNLMVPTAYGLQVPAWVADFLEVEYDQLCRCETSDLAEVIEYLRDNYIGEPT